MLNEHIPYLKRPVHRYLRGAMVYGYMFLRINYLEKESGGPNGSPDSISMYFVNYLTIYFLPFLITRPW